MPPTHAAITRHTHTRRLECLQNVSTARLTSRPAMLRLPWLPRASRWLSMPRNCPRIFSNRVAMHGLNAKVGDSAADPEGDAFRFDGLDLGSVEGWHLEYQGFRRSARYRSRRGDVLRTERRA